MTKRTYTHRVLHNGEHWSRHGSYKLAQQEIRKTCSRFNWNADNFTIQEIEGV